MDGIKGLWQTILIGIAIVIEIIYTKLTHLFSK